MTHGITSVNRDKHNWQLSELWGRGGCPISYLRPIITTSSKKCMNTFSITLHKEWNEMTVLFTTSRTRGIAKGNGETLDNVFCAFVFHCGASNNNLISRGCLQSSAPWLWPTSLSSASCLRRGGRNDSHLRGPWLQWGQKRVKDRWSRSERYGAPQQEEGEPSLGAVFNMGACQPLKLP